MDLAFWIILLVAKQHFIVDFEEMHFPRNNKSASLSVFSRLRLVCFINYCTWVHCLSPHKTHILARTHRHTDTPTHRHTNTQTLSDVDRQIQLQFPVHFSLNCTHTARQMGLAGAERQDWKDAGGRHYSIHKISTLTPTLAHPPAPHSRNQLRNKTIRKKIKRK